MESVGFRRRGEQYFHPKMRFFVEFPVGPLGIGRDLAVKPVRIRIGGGARRIRALSATDCCRDRLAAFYHWNDRQSLDAAVDIAFRNAIDMAKVRTWSAREGARERFQEFSRELARARSRQKVRASVVR